MRIARRPWIVLAVVAAALLTACGSGGGGGMADHSAMGDAKAPVEGAPQVELTAVDIDYRPDTLELTAGEATNVTVTNEGETLHDFSLEEADVHMDIEPGASETTSLTIDEPGTYLAICTVAGHEDAGMTIDVTVE